MGDELVAKLAASQQFSVYVGAALELLSPDVLEKVRRGAASTLRDGVPDELVADALSHLDRLVDQAIRVAR